MITSIIECKALVSSVFLGEISARETNTLAKQALDKIGEAGNFFQQNGMTPCVYAVRLPNAGLRAGFNFVPVGTKPGESFHYDHGCGIAKNQDAKVLWVKER